LTYWDKQKEEIRKYHPNITEDEISLIINDKPKNIKGGNNMPKKRKGRNFTHNEKLAYHMKTVLNSKIKIANLWRKDSGKKDLLPLINDPTMGEKNAERFILKHKNKM
jgi:hypothetical protein